MPIAKIEISCSVMLSKAGGNGWNACFDSFGCIAEKWCAGQ